MADKVVFSTIINGTPIIVTINDNRTDEMNADFFYIKVEDTWSINQGSDMTLVVKALITENFDVLAYGSEHLIAFRNDLERANVISKAENDNIGRLRREYHNFFRY